MNDVNPHEEHKVGVTIKYGEGYQAPWLTLHGTVAANRQNIIEAFGMEPEKAEGLTLSELVIEASSMAQAQANAAGGLGAKSTGSNRGNWSKKKSSGTESTGSTESPAEPEGPKEHPLVAVLKSAETVDALQRTWAENQGEFNEHPELMAAYKARGTELTAAA